MLNQYLPILILTNTYFLSTNAKLGIADFKIQINIYQYLRVTSPYLIKA